MLKSSNFTLAGVVALATIAGVVLWNALDLGPKWAISSGVSDLANGQHIERARKELLETPRGPTVEALKQALEDDSGTPWGKVQVLQLLGQFKESRMVRRALDSDVKSTQRGAAYLRQTDPAVAERVAEIAMDWLEDAGSADRRLAILILRTTDRREAIPHLLKILDEEGKNETSARVIIRVLDALGHFKPADVAPKVFALASDTSLQPAVRSEAMKVLTYLDDTPRGEFVKLLMSIATDKDVHTTLRTNAVSLLGRPQNATPDTWELLKTILLDSENRQLQIQILQRTALRSLVASYPMAKLGELLLDRRVYAHPYFGIRTDVAAGIGTLRIKSRLSLQVLSELMAEEDAGDFTDNVPRQAWISFWMVTGFHTGSSKPELYRQRPKQMTDNEALRIYVFSIGRGNPTVSEAQVRALDVFTLTRDDSKLRRDDPDAYRRIKAEKVEKCKAISQILRGNIEQLLEPAPGDEKPEEKKPDEKDD